MVLIVGKFGISFIDDIVIFLNIGQVAGLCSHNEFRCKNGYCINETLVCDSENDCGDNSDEENCEVSPCVFGACSQICEVKKKFNYTCYCAPGYKLGWEKTKTCVADGK